MLSKPFFFLIFFFFIRFRDQQKEILVWGNNRNYNLGLEDKEGKSYPHYLDYFSKQNVSINSVSLSCYHCLYVDDKGKCSFNCYFFHSILINYFTSVQVNCIRLVLVMVGD